MHRVLTTCCFCACGCNLYLEVENGNIVGVIPSREHPVSRGNLCVKGWNSFEFVLHKERLRFPLIRKNGRLERAEWNEALDLKTGRQLGPFLALPAKRTSRNSFFTQGLFCKGERTF